MGRLISGVDLVVDGLRVGTYEGEEEDERHGASCIGDGQRMVLGSGQSLRVGAAGWHRLSAGLLLLGPRLKEGRACVLV